MVCTNIYCVLFQNQFKSNASNLLAGIAENVELGVNFPSRNFELIRDVDLISEQEYQDIKRHTEVINPIMKHNDTFKIVLLLILTELDDHSSALRFRSAILSAIFHIESEALGEQAIAPFLEIVYRVKEVYKSGKKFFDLFSQSQSM